ncbi:uncharacterized protein [Miscanthus floridulus]|uniref:uncharacterized protein isoform X2 n=1 Tax=Miscanthus floridulus TaxID=154761 RepID=UPI0034591519
MVMQGAKQIQNWAFQHKKKLIEMKGNRIHACIYLYWRWPCPAFHLREKANNCGILTAKRKRRINRKEMAWFKMQQPREHCNHTDPNYAAILPRKRHTSADLRAVHTDSKS